MNVNEAIESAAEFRADMEVRPFCTLFSETVAIILAAEVERLRAEIKQIHKDYGCEVRDPCGTIWDHAANLQKELEQVKAELAAAKAGLAMVPVEVAEIREVFFPNQNPMWSVDVRFMYLEERAAFATWIRQQLKQIGKNVPIDFGPLVDDRLES